MESESKVEVTSKVKADVDTIIDSKIKTSNKVEKIAILSYSGGIVSSTYLLELLGSGYDKVYALFFDYDNKYPIQKQSADEVVKYLETIPGISDKLEYNKLSVKISERSSTTISAIEDSDKVSEKELFLNLDALVSLAEKIYDDKYKDCTIDIHLGLTSDTNEDYLFDYSVAIKSVSDRLIEGAIEIKTMYLLMTKADAVMNGKNLSELNGIDFNSLYKRTNTTPRTIKIGNKLYSDITDETVSGRVFAFHQNGLVDPIKYANESGVMTWAEVVTYFGGTSTTDDLGNVVLSEIDVVDIADIPASSEQPKVEGEIVVPFQPENPNKKNYTQVTIIN